MLFQYIFIWTTSIIFFIFVCNYLKNVSDFPFVLIELFFTIFCFIFGITCSFKDPGIITFKSSVFTDIEEIKFPEGLSEGHDYYKLFNKNSFL